MEGGLAMNLRPIERWIRRAAIVLLAGLAIEAITLRILHPLSFMTFATAGSSKDSCSMTWHQWHAE